MPLAIFDLDNTLIAGDSDHAWGEFLVEKNLVDADVYRQQNDLFYEAYLEGSLNIADYLDFSLAPLARYPKADLLAWRKEFFDNKIRPIILDQGIELINRHKQVGDVVMIITATNRFVTQPIAEALRVEHLIAVEVEENAQGYTGKPVGVPSYREGKITRLEAWLEQRTESLDGAYFYSDSHNDIPLLEKVDHPVAVDPDPTLKAHCQTKEWPVISLRN